MFLTSEMETSVDFFKNILDYVNQLSKTGPCSQCPKWLKKSTIYTLQLRDDEQLLPLFDIEGPLFFYFRGNSQAMLPFFLFYIYLWHLPQAPEPFGIGSLFSDMVFHHRP